MSEHSAFGFGKFVPGFDFLQNLAQSASKATPAAGGIPGMSSWVAPTLSVEELDKRIQELKAVQFWLEQNGTALKATIQALEVQKMTLSTLQNMNVNMADLAKAFTARAPEATAAAAAPQAAPETPAEPAPAAAPSEENAEPEAATAKAQRRGKNKAQDPGQAATGVDPMAWWGSLTQQFQDIASAAMKDVAAEALKAQASAKAPPTETAGQAKAPARKASAKTSPAATRKPAAKKAASGRAKPAR